MLDRFQSQIEVSPICRAHVTHTNQSHSIQLAEQKLTTLDVQLVQACRVMFPWDTVMYLLPTGMVEIGHWQDPSVCNIWSAINSAAGKQGHKITEPRWLA